MWNPVKLIKRALDTACEHLKSSKAKSIKDCVNSINEKAQWLTTIDVKMIDEVDFEQLKIIEEDLYDLCEDLGYGKE